MTDTRLLNAARSLLDNLAFAMDAAGIDVPERRYVHSGQVVFDFSGDDCASALIVSWAGSFQGQVDAAGSRTGVIKCQMPLAARFQVYLLRCAPGLDEEGDPPTDEQLDAAAEEVLTDSMTMAAVVVDETLQKALFEDFINVTGIEQILPVGPAGYAGGTQMTILTSLLAPYGSGS